MATSIGLRDSLVVIPTYKEVENLKPLVLRVLLKGAFDILIVDDNSPDGTGQLADVLAGYFPDRVAVAHRPEKLGLGTAYLLGFHYALERGYRHVFEMDADFSHDPDRLPALRAALDTADVVLGSRYVAGGGAQGLPLWRRVISQAGSAYAGWMLGLPFRDLTGGFKGFRREVLQSMDLDAIRSNGYSFQIEVTNRCHQLGFQIVEVPIQFAERRRGKSKMNWRIIAEALFMVLSLRLKPPVSYEPLPRPRSMRPAVPRPDGQGRAAGANVEAA